MSGAGTAAKPRLPFCSIGWFNSTLSDKGLLRFNPQEAFAF